MSNIVKRKLKIIGMHCSSCAINIDYSLEDLEGIMVSKTNFYKQEIEIEFDMEKVDIPRIVSQIKTLGYTAKAVI